jgi:hypothetical protein
MPLKLRIKWPSAAAVDRPAGIVGLQKVDDAKRIIERAESA